MHLLSYSKVFLKNVSSKLIKIIKKKTLYLLNQFKSNKKMYPLNFSKVCIAMHINSKPEHKYLVSQFLAHSLSKENY